jgi:hypothetical protein
MTATYENIATTTLGSNQASVTFSTISGSFTDLVLVASGRSNNAANTDTYLMTFNGDTANNYSRTRLLGNGSSASSAGRSNAPNIDFEGISGNNAASGVFSLATVALQNYSNTTTNKTVLIRGNDANGTVLATVGLYRSSSAITSITLAPSNGTQILSGSTFTLYGIKAE